MSSKKMESDLFGGLLVVCQNGFRDALADYAGFEKVGDGFGHCHHLEFFTGFNDGSQEISAFSSDDVLCGVSDNQHFAADSLFAIDSRDKLLMNHSLQRLG